MIFSDVSSSFRRIGGRRVGAALLAAAGVLGAAARSATAAPFVPSGPEIVLEVLPPRTGAAWEAIRELHAELATRPGDARAAALLARRYLELNRGSGDPRLVAYARRALASWDSDAAPPPEVALERALVAQTEHRFDEARAELQALAEREPREAEVWLTLAALDTVQGRYADAERACRAVVLLADASVVAGCVAGVQAQTGRAEAALSLLVGQLARAPVADGSLDAWLATLAAETAANLGRAEHAERYFATALAASVDDPSIYLLTAYADFLLQCNRPEDALELLRSAPPADAVLLRRAVAQRRVGDDATAIVDTLRYRLALALERNDAIHAREAAYFALYLLDEPQRALALALDNWAVQRESVDARLVLEAAQAAGEPAAAEPVRAWVAASDRTPLP